MDLDSKCQVRPARHVNNMEAATMTIARDIDPKERPEVGIPLPLVRDEPAQAEEVLNSTPTPSPVLILDISQDDADGFRVVRW